MPKDQDIRDKITGNSFVSDLKKLQFVKAGAGAGKTTSIKNRVLNLIAKLNVDPERMVIITYTTKAANELLTRIREELESNIEKSNVKEAIHKLGNAKISTFHSFCYDLLREYPIEFSIDPDLELSDEKMTNIMLDNCFNLMEEELYSDMGNLEDDFIEKREIFSEFIEDSNPKEIANLKETLLTLYQNRDLTPISANLSSVRDISHLDTEIESSIRTYYTLANELFGSIIPGKEEDGFYQHLLRIMGKISGYSQDEFLSYILDGNEDIIKGKGRKDSYRNGDVLSKLKTCVKEFQDSFKYRKNLKKVTAYNTSISIYKYFEHIVESYKALYGIIDFFDCLYLVKKGLDNSDVLRQLVQDRFDVVMIDEFQDSDPMQTDIAFNLAGKNKDKLFFVGDPKQSIYSFSRADISVYLDVMKEVINSDEGEVLELTTNFRSSEGLLDFVNDNFKGILKDLDYSPMDVSDKNRGASFSADMWTVDPDIKRPREAFMIAKEIDSLINGKDYRPGDFLILFRSGTSMEDYENALKAFNIPVINTKSKNFLKQSDVIELLNLMALTAFPEDKYYQFAVEDSDLINIEKPILNSVLEGSDTFISKFRKLCEVAGVTALALNTNSAEYIGLTENLISIAQSEFIGNRYNLKLTFSRLFDKALNDSFFKDKDKSLADESLYIQTKKPNAVRLMTIHASKGLESKVVILSAHDGSKFKGDKYVDRNNNSILIKSPFISSKIAKELDLTNFSELYNRAEQLKDEEEKRVLYVAVTRAKERFILITKSDKNSTFIQALLDETPTFSTKRVLQFSDYEDDYSEMDGDAPIEIKSRDYVSLPDIYTRFQGLDSHSKPVTDIIEDLVVFKGHKGRKNGLEFGSFVHLVMENLCNIIFSQKNIEIDTDKLVDKISSISDFNMTKDNLVEIKSMLSKFMSSDIPSIIIGADSIQTEFPFYSEENYHGIIDLIIEDNDSIRIIDFKSDLLGDNSEEIKEHYHQQIDYYVRAITKYSTKRIKGDCLFLFE